MNEQQLNRALYAMAQQRNQALDEAVRLQVEIAELREEIEKLRAEAKPAEQ